MIYKKILIAIDSSNHALHAAKKGVALAKQLTATIGLLFVVNKKREVINSDLGITPEQSSTVLLKQAGETIEQIIKLYDLPGDVFHFMPEGFPKEEIVKTAKEWEADLIVIGAHGKSGLLHLLMGSVTEHVIRHSPVPVMVVSSG